MALLVIILFLTAVQCAEMHDGEAIPLILEPNVTAVLGQEVSLRCLYRGDQKVVSSSWSREDFKKTIKLASFNGHKNFGKEGFSTPASFTNLTVTVNISRVEAEGHYTCQFDLGEEIVKDTLFIRVLVQPNVSAVVKEEVVNGTHYQSVTCSADGARPEPRISWEVGGAAPSGRVFTTKTESSSGPSGSSSLTSVLRFPTHMIGQDRVECVVQHPALSKPRRISAQVQMFATPNITIETALSDRGRRLEVTCRATGGRPRPIVTWLLDGDAPTATWADSNSVSTSYSFPTGHHEGENLTCEVSHPTLPRRLLRTVVTPTYYLSSVHLHNRSTEPGSVEVVRVGEGVSSLHLLLDVQGNVPYYLINCTKEGSPLPQGVEVVGTTLRLLGPVKLLYSGLYECVAYFHAHRAGVQLNISVQARVPPAVKVKTRKEADSVLYECVASDAFPAPNVTWTVPHGVEVSTSQSTTTHSGTFSSSNVLMVASCVPREEKVECVVEHELLEEAERREMMLPRCASPNITLQYGLDQDEGHVLLTCTVESVRTRPHVSWHVEGAENNGRFAGVPDLLVEDSHDVLVIRNMLKLSLAEFAGRSVACVVQHESLEEPENKTIHLPSRVPLVANATVGPQRDHAQWLAVCEIFGDVSGVNVSWILPDNNTATTSTPDPQENKVTASYQFQLFQHEGQTLTCLVVSDQGAEVRKPVLVPRYYISSVTVLNQTTRAFSDGRVVHQLALEEGLPQQKILFKVYGNVTSYKMSCFRSDGSAARTLGGALLFPQPASRHEEGLYTCHASYCHHTATVQLEVTVTSSATQYMVLASVCFSSAAAVVLVLGAVLCVFCKKNVREPIVSLKHKEKRESVGTLLSLMQDSRSPEVRKASLAGGRDQAYAELVSFSIVLMEKSTV
ncbi:uncharacterized protein LOC114802243 isoform X2 [Denticeps clupeoides]|uniref:Ig-like domain-containing protein n=1 Tax=Denticeps clupeoides TaxID=299321 RepID=A0AAY4B261_9TELE|nr:uncharacterized protein LOC114802243 isoform X2 [Denticeps clupeoides]